MERFLILVILFLPVTTSAEIYKWVDENGRVHYGDKPVSNANTMDVDTAKKGHIDTSESRKEKRRNLLNALDEDKQRVAEENKKKKDEKKKRERQCLWAKDRLKSYKRASYLYNLDKDGNRVVVDNDARQKVTAKLQKNIQKYCK